MVTGRAPFLSDNVVGVISQHIHAPPVAPSWHNPEIPQGLERLILRLLEKAPEQRPQSAASVSEELEGIAGSGLAVTDRVTQGDTRSLDRLHSGVFVGRERELQEIRAALRDVSGGSGRLLLIAGEPGSGKTRVTEQLSIYARLRNAPVLVDRKSTRLNSSHIQKSRMPSSA